MAENDENNMLLDSPTEYLASLAASDGYCIGQSVLPVNDGEYYVCHCSCGHWDIEAPTRAEGLRLARIHTRPELADDLQQTR
jgi:hypothetical protein